MCLWIVLVVMFPCGAGCPSAVRVVLVVLVLRYTDQAVTGCRGASSPPPPGHGGAGYGQASSLTPPLSLTWKILVVGEVAWMQNVVAVATGAVAPFQAGADAGAV